MKPIFIGFAIVALAFGIGVAYKVTKPQEFQFEVIEESRKHV